MKTSTIAPVHPEQPTLFQMAARMTGGRGTTGGKAGPVITEHSFASLRREAKQAKHLPDNASQRTARTGARPAISFDTVRLMVVARALRQQSSGNNIIRARV